MGAALVHSGRATLIAAILTVLMGMVVSVVAAAFDDLFPHSGRLLRTFILAVAEDAGRIFAMALLTQCAALSRSSACIYLGLLIALLEVSVQLPPDVRFFAATYRGNSLMLAASFVLLGLACMLKFFIHIKLCEVEYGLFRSRMPWTVLAPFSAHVAANHIMISALPHVGSDGYSFLLLVSIVSVALLAILFLIGRKLLTLVDMTHVSIRPSS